MASNGFQGSYANERPASSLSSQGPGGQGSGDAEIGTDPASSGFFITDYKKHDDLKSMLDGNKDSLKLEAMKRIISMVAKGRDCSDLFPAVVKNVVSKNAEVKKLVYVYLVRYAEEQQDLALLSISTFQRALKDPNQLIRASALRVLSSIRVPVIVPIMMLAIKEAVMDMSPYVRKTAAHAIPKLYSLDPEQKEIMIETIEKLLGDKTTLVAGSAIQAFEEVCPERIDLIHKNYRKLCNLLVDVEEWGQVVIIQMLTRYCRTQFVNPNQDDIGEEEKPFYGSEDSSQEEEEESKPKKKPFMMDPDHRLLLRTCRPLLNSRNASVVMSVAQFYHHCAPRSEVNIVSKAMVRLLRSHKEVQFVVLSNIASMSTTRKGLFEPFLKSFFVRSNDPIHIKLLKLEILTTLATEANISTILREFQTYVTSQDREFAAATIQAIGRCASNISEITDACMNGLVFLMSNRDETVVAESVVVIKKLLQMRPSEHKDIIVHMAKLADEINVPMARASILWLIGEYSDRVPKIAPDVLRKMAKEFVGEEDIVKLQILNLAAKLCITNSKQTKLLCQYVFNLAKYDQNYDIRDRARFLRALILPNEKTGNLTKHVKKIFLATKPAPVLQSTFHDRDSYQLGTLSHLLNMRGQGYQELPEWPEVAPDPSVRNVEVILPWSEAKPKHVSKKDKKIKKKSFYSDSESSPTDEDTSNDDSDEEDDDSDEEDESDSEEEEEESSEAEQTNKMRKKSVNSEGETESEEESEEEEETDSEEEESSEEESSSEEEVVKPAPKPTKKKQEARTEEKPAKPSADMLLDLDDVYSPASITSPGSAAAVDMLTPSLASEKSFTSPNSVAQTPSQMFVAPSFVPTKKYELLNRMTTGGLSAVYKFTRTVSIFSPKMVSVELTFTNHGEAPINEIKLGDKKLQSGMDLQDFPEIPLLGVNASSSVLFGIDFNDTTQPASFEICTKERKFSVSIKAPVGELLTPTTMGESEFKKKVGKLTGMNENNSKIDLPEDQLDQKLLCTRVFEAANIVMVPSSSEKELFFAAKSLASGTEVLVRLKLNGNNVNIFVNCEKMVIGSMLVKEIKESLGR